MDRIAVAAVLGVVMAGGCGLLLGKGFASWRERRKRTQLLFSQNGGARHPAWLDWRLRNGVALFNPLAETALRREPVKRYATWIQLSLEERGLEVPQTSLLSLVLTLVLILVVLGWAVTGALVFGVALAGCALVGVCGFAHGEVEKREGAMRDEIPDALRSLGVCFKAGLSLVQTLKQTGSEMKGPLGQVFLASARRLETGGTATEALSVFKQRSSTPELAFVAVALDVQHHTGGSIAHVLDAARESVEGEIELERSLKVQTAQAKLSARIVTLMPFVLIALFSLMSPDFLSPFFESALGVAMLVVALVMQVAGVLMVHRMLDIDMG